MPPFKTFSIFEPVDMWRKLEWEHHELLRMAVDPTVLRPDRAYVAVNAAMTAWHMLYWMCGNMAPAGWKNLSKAVGEPVSNCREFERFVLREKCIFQCEQIAVAAKHFQPSPRHRDVRAEDVNWQLSDGQRVSYQLVVSEGGESETIHNVIGDALKFWGRMLKASGMATENDLIGADFKL